MGMSRRANIIPNCPHHIIHRGNNRRRLFSYPRDYHKLIAQLHDAVEATDCKVHALCLMANHLHAIVTPPSVEAMREFVKGFAQRYARYRNDERDGSGKLFEGPYWREPIKSVFHLAVATMYIDRNPVAARIKDCPEDYRWSTFRQHAGIGNPERWIAELCTPTEWWFGLGSSDEARAAEYNRLFEQYSATALAREQARFFGELEGRNRRSYKRVERPDRSRASEDLEVARYGLKRE